MAARDEWEPLDGWNVPVLLRGKVELVADGQLSSGDGGLVRGLRAADGQDHSGEAVEVLDWEDLQIRTYDNGIHPAYWPPDLSEYGVRSGEGNNVKEANFLAAAAGIQFLERGLHEYNAVGLWDHYYGNTGELFVLSSAVVDQWMVEMNTDYGRGGLGEFVDPPGPLVLMDREYAINRAVQIAKGRGASLKYTYSSRWRLTAGISGDYVHSLGRHSSSTLTTVIARPYPNGVTYVQFDQVVYYFDHYDFAYHDTRWGAWQENMVNVAYEGMRLGIAKPFEVQGESAPVTGFRAV
ncbi:hypothetical protein Csp1_02140 [Corynebacterium provencense]|uniref:Uncharacterized protein n=1 Tax=Corynebacterium provencense TaxID=1737425 RepID=A0A2Z3YM56_9CORY|nr:hypothetical protein [Corynebacterium provencense]AWT25042.1 hypothetical protein Csp1_02140 [Corynebacterium provencense]